MRKILMVFVFFVLMLGMSIGDVYNYGKDSQLKNNPIHNQNEDNTEDEELSEDSDDDIFEEMENEIGESDSSSVNTEEDPDVEEDYTEEVD